MGCCKGARARTVERITATDVSANFARTNRIVPVVNVNTRVPVWPTDPYTDCNARGHTTTTTTWPLPRSGWPTALPDTENTVRRTNCVYRRLHQYRRRYDDLEIGGKETRPSWQTHSNFGPSFLFFVDDRSTSRGSVRTFSIFLQSFRRTKAFRN